MSSGFAYLAVHLLPAHFASSPQRFRCKLGGLACARLIYVVSRRHIIVGSALGRRLLCSAHPPHSIMVLDVPSTSDGKALTAYAKMCPQLEVSKADTNRNISVAKLRREQTQFIIDKA